MQIEFDSNCVTARLTGRMTDEFVKALDQRLAPYEPGYFYSPAYKHHRWDGKNHFLDTERMAFPAGLAHHVQEFIKVTLKQDVEIADHRPAPVWMGRPALEIPSLHGVTLEDDQIEALNAGLAGGQGCLCLPTGFGKTEVAAVLAEIIKPLRMLFLVNKKGLLTQAAERLEERLQTKVGRFWSGRKDTDARITVGTIQSLWSQRKKLQKLGFFDAQHLVIYDECHTIAKMGLRLLSLIHAPARIGLSATIKEAPRKMFIEAFLGPVLLEKTFEELVATGRAAVPEITMFRIGGIARGDDFNGVYWDGIVQNSVRNRVIEDLVWQHFALDDGPEQTMVLVFRIEHGQLLKERLEDRLVRGVPFIHGGTDLFEIEHVKRKFSDRAIPVMIVSSIFDMGQDIPAIDVMVMAAAGKAPLRTIQRMGRATRRKADRENTVTIYDFFDMSHPWLKDHAEQRVRTYKRKGFPATLLAQPKPARRALV